MGLLSFAIFLALCSNLEAEKLVEYENIENLDQLNDAIKNGPNRKVGFLSHGNFESVEAFLGGFQLLDLIITELKSHVTC